MKPITPQELPEIDVLKTSGPVGHPSVEINISSKGTSSTRRKEELMQQIDELIDQKKNPTIPIIWLVLFSVFVPFLIGVALLYFPITKLIEIKRENEKIGVSVDLLLCTLKSITN